MLFQTIKFLVICYIAMENEYIFAEAQTTKQERWKELREREERREGEGEGRKEGEEGKEGDRECDLS